MQNHRKFKLYEIPQSLVQGNKFLKWTESSLPGGVIGVTLKVDENGFILYWRDLNKKSDYLDIAHIKDVRIGKYANVPKEKNIRDVLSSGQSNVPIEDKTISIYFGSDFVNVQCINFVSMAPDANKVIIEWSQCISECSFNPRTQNLSPWEHLNKLRTILLYGKSVIDEKSREFRLSVQTVVDLFATTDKQHVESERQHVYHMLQSAGLPTGKNDFIDEKMLTQEKFFQFFLCLVTKEDVEKILKDHGTKKKLCMSPEQFQNFFNEKQRDPRLNELLYPYYTLEKSCEMILKFETDESFRKKKQLSPQGLIRYLMDVENEVIDPAFYELSDNMEQPLCHYFINSSHNTYLSGHQVTGKTEAEMYRQVLLSGCRCIELDCWDDRNLDEPIITHGLTFCTQILFKDAIEAIKESAFKTSPYPVLLSFENHCSKSMQAKMAKYLVDCFGDSLLIDPLPPYPLKPGVKLPSPEELKYKILIKNKKSEIETQETGARLFSIKSIDQTNTDDFFKIQNNLSQELAKSSTVLAIDANNSQVLSSKTASVSNIENKLVYNSSADIAKILQNFKKLGTVDFDENTEVNRHNSKEKIDQNSLNIASFSALNSDDDESDDEKNSAEKTITAKEMSRIVNYLQPVDFQSFDFAEKRNRSYELSSFLETKAYNLHKEKSTEFVNYNKRQFSRIYPKSTRIASDNFMPQVFWNVGCQLVALNFQTLDVGMRLNLGKFEYNNRTGYILKPDVMRRVDVNKPFDPFAESSIDGIVPATVNVQVISGIFCNDKRGERTMGSTVLVEMFGLPTDTLKGQRAYRAKMASSNTFNVVYAENFFSFKKIIMPQIALMCFSAFDDQNRLIGQRILPVTALRSGYRYVCLKNESNQPLNMCMLFLNITVKDYVPDKFTELANALADPIRYISNLEKREEMLKSLSDDVEVIMKERTSEIEIQKKDYTSKHRLIFQTTHHEAHSFDFPNMNSKTKFSQSNSIEVPTSAPINCSNISLNINNNNSNNSSLNSLTTTNYLLQNQERLSITSEKPIIASTSALSYAQPFQPEIKRNSQYDISRSLGNSMLLINIFSNNKKRSISLSANNEYTSKIPNAESSHLVSDDPNLFTDIDIDELRKNKSYVNIVQSYNKKIKKLEKETEKKVSEIIQYFHYENDRNLNDYARAKQKLEKEISKAEKSTAKLGNFTETSGLSTEMLLSYRIQFETIENNLINSVTQLQEKITKDILIAYFEMFKQIKNIQISSLDPLYAKLEKWVFSLQEQRLQSLKIMSEKESAEVYKQVHQDIKFKKKEASKTSLDKEEFLRLTREIEKESVTSAVNENQKMRELLKIKEKLLKNVIDKSMNSLRDQKERQKLNYENDFKKHFEMKKEEILEEITKLSDSVRVQSLNLGQTLSLNLNTKFESTLNS